MIRVLQLGPQNWAEQYQIPMELTWEYNNFSSNEDQHYAVVILTGKPELSSEQWEKLHWLVDPYCVLYLPTIKQQLDPNGYNFLKSQMALPITEDFQQLINRLAVRYFQGQSGARIKATSILFNQNIDSYEVSDSGHVNLVVNSIDDWTNIGNYQTNLYIDPHRLLKLWLEYQSASVQVRLRLFIQQDGSDGNPTDCFILTPDPTLHEIQLPIEASAVLRFASISLEVKGKGQLCLGNLHSRWSRDGVGSYLAGGKRIVDPASREELAYYFNPGDLRPPLNVYFAGARQLEGFEAYPMFRRLQTPTLLFTDPRLEIGQFYTKPELETKIKTIILDTLKQLGFNRSQLIMNGISMGTHPALKLGSQLGVYMINVAKPIANLGLLAKRGRLERPDEFETIYDIDHQLVGKISQAGLTQLDKCFWQQFDQQDLTQTRLFVGYMIDDDYDNQAINDLKRSPAVQRARQFAYKGFPGHHNDSQEVINWFKNRLRQVLKNDFNRRLR